MARERVLSDTVECGAGKNGQAFFGAEHRVN